MPLLGNNDVLPTPPRIERRRPGRLENPNPALIALMRRPSPQARRQVQLFDAPHFSLADAEAPDRSFLNLTHLALATSCCLVVWGAVLKLMLWTWS